MIQEKNQLSENEKERVINYIKKGETIPKKYLYKMAKNDEDVFLFWNGRSEEVTNVVLPFHSIEHIDEPRKEKYNNKEAAFDFFETDNRGRQLSGWTNKLIWGDNKLILSSLANGPLRQEIEKQGGIKLIYIDPPFAVGADFGFDIKIGDDKVTKKQSVLEEIAYRDTWGRGISSYLSMMYERLKLMHELLAVDGSIYVHCDWRVNSILRLILDDIFGNDNFRNELIWCYQEREIIKSQYNSKHDNILFYTKNTDYIFNFNEIRESYSEVTIKKFKYTDPDGRKYRLRYKDGRSDPVKETHDTYRQYLDESGPLPRDWFILPILNQAANERVDYPTQKPEALLERIIKASSNEGDIVCDFFCGSGTTAAVAEKLGRKWIAADLGRFAVHTTRKRMIKVQRELKEAGNDFRSFEILNLGKYERRYFLNVNPNLSEAEQQKQLEIKHEQYLSLILQGYQAKRISGFKTLHGKKGDSFVHVGSLDFMVTKADLDAILEECVEKTIIRVDVLGFEFEMGLKPYIKQDLAEYGVSLNLKNIPREVFDKRAVAKGQVKFYDVAYLKVQPQVKNKKVKVELQDFVTQFSQDNVSQIEKNMKKRSSKTVIESGQIVKIEKDKDGIVQREILTKNWYDWIDYWAVDFDYSSKKEIIKVLENGQEVQKWTGNYIFENEWQSFRTKKNNKLDFVSAEYEYAEKGKYKIAVRVVDILGNDTLQVVDVEV
jgi:DNA modification methylase